MIAPESINLATLPSVALCDRTQLPKIPCIYFAIDSQGVVQYIGQSINPRQRWVGHDRMLPLSKMSGVRIAYLFALERSSVVR